MQSWRDLEIWLWKIREDSLRWTLSTPRIYSLIGFHFSRQFFLLSISLWHDSLKEEKIQSDRKNTWNLWKMCFMSFNILHLLAVDKTLIRTEIKRNVNASCLVVYFFGLQEISFFKQKRNPIFFNVQEDFLY
jgi:hypothetical protein